MEFNKYVTTRGWDYVNEWINNVFVRENVLIILSGINFGRKELASEILASVYSWILNLLFLLKIASKFSHYLRYFRKNLSELKREYSGKLYTAIFNFIGMCVCLTEFNKWKDLRKKRVSSPTMKFGKALNVIFGEEKYTVRLVLDISENSVATKCLPA